MTLGRLGGPHELPGPSGAMCGTRPGFLPAACRPHPGGSSPPLQPTLRGPRCGRAGRTVGTPLACSAPSPTAGGCLWGYSCRSKWEAKQELASGPDGPDLFLGLGPVFHYQQALGIRSKRPDLLYYLFPLLLLVMLLN